MVRKCEGGAIFVELALGIPFLLLVVFALLFFASLDNAKTQLGLAVAEAPRLAASRGNPLLFSRQEGTTLVPATIQGDLDGFLADRSQWGLADQFLLKGVEPQNANIFYNTNRQWVFGWDAEEPPITLPLSDAHPIDIYAIAYAQRMIGMALGNQVRYPCDPAVELGCLQCQVLDPIRDKMNDPEPPAGDVWNPFFEFPNFISSPPKSILVCSYSMDSMLTRTIDGLFSLFGLDSIGIFVVSAITEQPAPPEDDTGGVNPP